MKAQRLLVCCLALVACGEDEAEPRTREQFCQDWAKAACNDEVVSVCQAEGPDECRQSQEDACRKLVTDDFSDAKGQACIDAVGDAYEDANLRDEELATVLRLAAPCDQLLKGTKGTGDSCTKRSDCDAPSGFDCVKKADKATGTCQIPEITGAGRKCDADQKTCEPGFYCDGDNCVEAGDVGDDCTIPEQCGETSYCNDLGECAERAATGESCSSDTECTTGICYEFDGDQECTDRIVVSRSEPICDDLR
jgi:hypothetical protein